ncbi:DISARM system SNF2-like helicase DrmD [Anaeromyxobacter oryzisoli]|uniref:DISARM system SNF2-like helicase DrmD n=1 Tax=Anaeromyxobacter oryzisoli TaxID=2925408 RepID=UPI001F56A3D7|nr:DISARM system SNF2-like helicase DrmD [Anaeromyxobacter sp. SG63]
MPVSDLAPGQLVQVRQRRYVVQEIAESALPPPPLKVPRPPQHLVQLSSVDDDGHGEELRVIWELEPGARVIGEETLPEPKGFDEPRRLDAFLDAIRWGAVASADQKHLHAPYRSGIQIEDYQLDPVVRALQMPRANLLVADDVGLGKTIEAGLVVQELLLRHRARSVLVVCPAGLQLQWRDQMRDKFGLEFRIVDSDLLKELRRTRGLHVNPWTHFPRLVTSIDFLKRDRPLRLFREVLPAEGEAAFPRRFDLLIVDEAHNVAPSGSGNYAIDSLRTQAVRALVPHFEHKLFLTATPHNGYSESFQALLELVDDQRFHRGAPIDQRQLGTIMVRRLKSELPPLWDGTPRFPKRELTAIEVDFPKEERQAHDDLARYAELRTVGAAAPAEVFALQFVLKLLKKRLFSSPAAFRRTLAKHVASLGRKATEASLAALQREAAGVDEEFADDEAWEEAAEDAVALATGALADLDGEAQSLLERLRKWADKADSKPDARAKALVAWLEETVKPAGAWSDRRAIVFTEYRDTQRWLHGILDRAGLGEEGRLAILYGGMPVEEREKVKAAFQSEESPVRILLATDAASEGIDLQNHCARLVHYEIPWNPNRLEQRNGRVDRHGQREKIVRIFHFVGTGWREAGAAGRPPGSLEGDLEFLARAAHKVETIREDLGKVGPVIAAQVEDAMLGRRTRLDIDRAVAEAEPARRMLKIERDVRARVAELAAQLRETKEELGISPETVQRVVEVGLALADQPPLIPAKVKGLWPDPERTSCPVFRLPELRGAWVRCADGLAHPLTEKIRPIVFDHALAEGREDVVLVHLDHRLVQMCLGLLRAEVWQSTGARPLHRVAARVVRREELPGPAVVAHARLVILGADNQKLHEELVTAGGVLTEGRFARFKSNAALASALEAVTDEDAPAEVKERLRKLWPKYRDNLLSAVEARAEERAESLRRVLAERAEKEARDVAALLEELRAGIAKALTDSGPPQLALFTSEEKDQLERNRAAMQARLDAIPGELKRETDAVRRRYAKPVARFFPVAVTYLVPASAGRSR